MEHTTRQEQTKSSLSRSSSSSSCSSISTYLSAFSNVANDQEHILNHEKILTSEESDSIKRDLLSHSWNKQRSIDNRFVDNKVLNLYLIFL